MADADQGSLRGPAKELRQVPVDWEALDRRDAEELAAIGSLGPSGVKAFLFRVGIVLLSVVLVVLTIVFALKYKGAF